MSELKMLKLNDNSYEYYRNKVKGNENISREQAERKLTRNSLLSFVYMKDSPAKKNPRTWYSYGALRFMVQNNEVKWIENNCRVYPMWYLDTAKYMSLSDELGIDKEHVKIYEKPVIDDRIQARTLKPKQNKNWLQRILKL
jgi:hypothetical protein